MKKGSAAVVLYGLGAYFLGFALGLWNGLHIK